MPDFLHDFISYIINLVFIFPGVFCNDSFCSCAFFRATRVSTNITEPGSCFWVINRGEGAPWDREGDGQLDYQMTWYHGLLYRRPTVTQNHSKSNIKCKYGAHNAKREGKLAREEGSFCLLGVRASLADRASELWRFILSNRDSSIVVEGLEELVGI